MKSIFFLLLLVLPFSVKASHPVCSEEDGDYKMIISKEEGLTAVNLDKTLNSIRESATAEKEGKYDDLTLHFNLSYINLYFMNKKIYRMVKEGKAIEFNEEQTTWYCRSIGKLPRTS